jgi:hypothetical protein
LKRGFFIELFSQKTIAFSPDRRENKLEKFIETDSRKDAGKKFPSHSLQNKIKY